MADPNSLQLKDYITLTLSISAFVTTLYNTFVLSRRGFKLSTFNAVVTLNKEFNEHFKNYQERSRKIHETNRTKEAKEQTITEKNEELTGKEEGSEEYKKLNKEIRDLEREAKHLQEDVNNLLSERSMDIENCMNIMDILYFGVHRLNILSDDLRYNFYRIAAEATKSFEEAGYGWVKTDYPNVTELVKSWTASDTKEKAMVQNSVSKNFVHLYQGASEMTVSSYQIIKKLTASYGLRLTYTILNIVLSVLGFLVVLIIFFQVFLSEG